MTLRILTVAIGNEFEVVAARQRAREIAALCGFAAQDQVRVATTVSELARNVYNYAGSGRVEFSIGHDGAGSLLQILIQDQGPGIPHLELVLSGEYVSSTGMGLGLLGARRLMDGFEVRTGAGAGTDITLEKRFPPGASAVTVRQVGDYCARLAAQAPDNMLAEVQQQNQELLAALAELKERQEQLLQLTSELEETNRGVVALYAELDEKAEHLSRADQTKSRFLSNMSHEFRTPLSSIRALAKLLLARVDGDLTDEQEKQVGFILQGSQAMTEMVNDLLDIAKIESGKTDVRVASFEVADMFGTLRGMLRPLLPGDAVTLVFDEPRGPCTLHTDEAKLSQILRNFISNALKFTERGEVVVSATAMPEERCMRFSVADTGIGIGAADLERIFEEFGQVENRLQAKVKGTGLGLPLCRSLAEILQGYVTVASSENAGSVFSVVVPITYTQSRPDLSGAPLATRNPN